MATETEKCVCGAKHRTAETAAKCAAKRGVEIAQPIALTATVDEPLPCASITADDLRFVLNYRGRLDRTDAGYTPVSLRHRTDATLVDYDDVLWLLERYDGLQAVAERLTIWASEPDMAGAR